MAQIPSIQPVQRDEPPQSPMKFVLLWFGLPLIVFIGLFILMSHL
jgi:hypothetical protein